jgi:hypothetical protein
MNTDFDQTKTVTLDDGSSVQVNVLAEEVSPSADTKFMLGMIDYEQLKKERIKENLQLEKEKDRIQKIKSPLDTSGNDLPPSLRNPLKEIEDLDETGTGTGEGEETTELSAKDAIAANQELFAELLGADKARGQDISDMLLRFSGSGGDTVGEKFKNYFKAESAAGPSRSEKIKQTAAGLAINDYVAGKRAKEQGELLTKKIDYELDAKERKLTPQADDSNSDILRKIATAYKIEPNSNKAIKALLKFRTGRSDVLL